MAKLTVDNNGVTIDDNGTQTFAKYADKNLGGNFQYLQNPTTRKIIGVGGDLFSKYGSDLASQGFNPVGQDVFSSESLRGLNLPAITGSDASPSSGTAETIRTDSSILGNLGQQVENIINQPATSADMATAYTNLENARQSINSFSDNDLTAIDEAGKQAGLQYDPLITEAEEAKRSGLPKALVGAGERGGLMNTQFAGAAALTPTQGGTFYGAGGELERIKSVYDANISKIRAVKEQAILQAKSAARLAITTGKKEDFDIASKLYDVARQSHQDSIDLSAKKLSAINAYNEEVRAGKAEDRAETTFGLDQALKMFSIIKDVPAGETMTLNGIEFTGINKESVDPFFKGSDIVALMKTLPVGTTQTLTDPVTGTEYSITGLSSDDPNIKSVEATDDKGVVSVTRYNQDTGEILSQHSLGKIGKSKAQAANISIVMNDKQKADLADAMSRLQSSMGGDGYYNTDIAINEVAEYGIKNPGKTNQLLDVIKNRLNPNDPRARQVITGQVPKGGGTIKMTNPSGKTIEIPVD
jgi:hypothetical protein